MKLWAIAFKFAVAISFSSMISVNYCFIFGVETWNKVLTGAEFYPEYNYQQQDHLTLLFVELVLFFQKFTNFETFDPSVGPLGINKISKNFKWLLSSPNATF